MIIIYSKHALKKFRDLEELGIRIYKNFIRKTIKDPVYLDEITDSPNLIASGNLNKNHLLRIVYRKEDDIIVIITFYPSRKERYLK